MIKEGKRHLRNGVLNFQGVVLIRVRREEGGDRVRGSGGGGG